MEKAVVDKLKYLINKKRSFNEIKESLGLEAYEIYGLVYMLKREGYPYDIANGEVIKVKYPELMKNNVQYLDPENKSELCMLSDIHYASIYDRPDLMEKIYNECQKRGIGIILCCGDVTDGFYPTRRDGISVVKYTSAQKQAEYVANIHPYDPNIKFYMIGGNHDETHKYNEGIDVCDKI